MNTTKTNPHHAIVIGAGIIGVTTASLLRRQGMDVTVLEALPGPGLGTSYANAGELSFGYSGPWATPRLLTKLPSMLFGKQSPLVIRPDISSTANLMTQLRWLAWFGLNTKQTRFERNKRRILNLSRVSKAVRVAAFDHISMDFHHQQMGTLQLFRSQASFDKVLKNDVAALELANVNLTVANVDQCVTQEPGLERIAKSIAGGLIFHDDETGDCHRFTQQLSGLEASMGVNFAYGVKVNHIVADKYGVRGVETNRGRFDASTVILACGPWTPALAAELRLVVPIYPVRGYSMSVPQSDDVSVVRSTILDEDTKIAITKLGSTIRVGGTAEICNTTFTPDMRRRDMLARTLAKVFPDSIQPDTARTYWHGHRPMTPDGTPVVGGTGIPGLYINAGHGTLGWTQSFASAQLISDLVTNADPILDPRDYELARYGNEPPKSYKYRPLGAAPGKRGRDAKVD